MEYCKICGKELNESGFCNDPECKYDYDGFKLIRSNNTIQQDLNLNNDDYQKLMNQLFDEL